MDVSGMDFMWAINATVNAASVGQACGDSGATVASGGVHSVAAFVVDLASMALWVAWEAPHPTSVASVAPAVCGDFVQLDLGTWFAQTDDA
jgi:hypothetical protein